MIASVKADIVASYCKHKDSFFANKASLTQQKGTFNLKLENTPGRNIPTLKLITLIKSSD